MSHLFKCEPYEDGIAKETCACGSVRFAVNGYYAKPEQTVLLERCQALNTTQGKEVTHEVSATKHREIMPEIMPSQMEVKPMENSAPPKPQGGGKGPGSKNIVVSAYYNFHKNEILADADRMGIDAMRKKWSIPSGTWTGLKRRWNVTASPKPAAKVQYELVEKSGPIIILLQAMSDRLSALKTQIEEINIGASIFIPTDIEEEVIAAMITAKPMSQTNTDLAKRILRVVKAMEGV